MLQFFLIYLYFVLNKKGIVMGQREIAIKMARQAAENAYAPYSNFRVGATIRCGDKYFSGVNIENASYGLTICAERVAIFSAIALGHKKIDEIAVACIDAPDGAPANSLMPCGACRQVMAEFLDENAKIMIDRVGVFNMKEILPVAFTLKCESVD
jgi:cytidine deaminase